MRDENGRKVKIMLYFFGERYYDKGIHREESVDEKSRMREAPERTARETGAVSGLAEGM